MATAITCRARLQSKKNEAAERSTASVCRWLVVKEAWTCVCQLMLDGKSSPTTANTYLLPGRLSWCRSPQTHLAAVHDEHAGATSRLPSFSPNCKSLHHTSTCLNASHAGLQRDVWSRLTEPGSSRPHLVHVLWRSFHRSLFWNGFSSLFLGTQKVAIGSCMCFQANCGEIQPGFMRYYWGPGLRQKFVLPWRPPQNGSEISTVYGSRNGPCKYIRFGATLRNVRDNFSPSPAFAGLRFQNFRKKRKPGQPPKQICRKPKETRKNLGKPSANWKTCMKPAKPCGNPAETHAKTMEIRRNSENPSQNVRKPCGNPQETLRKPKKTCRKPPETLRKPFANPAETQGNPYIHPLEIKKYLNEGWRPATSKEELQGPRHSIIRPAVAKECAALWSQRSTIPLF